MKPQIYTVVGFCFDTNQRFCSTFEAMSPDEAEVAALESEGDLHVCAVFEGELQCVDADSQINPPLP